MPGDSDGVYCTKFADDQKVDRCFPYWHDSDDARCPEGSEPANAGVYVCIPESYFSTYEIEKGATELLAKSKCDESNYSGACPEGKTCVDGECKDAARRVETASSLTQKYYLATYATLLTGPIEMDPTFYDQLNIYRVGSGQTNTPAAGYQQVTFENPYTGEIYAANDMVCEELPDGSLTSTCYEVISEVIQPGGAMLVKKAQELSDQLIPLWEEVLDYNKQIPDGDDAENSEAYQKFIDVYYKWYMTKYDLNDVLRDINIVRGVYDYFGSVW